MTTYTTPHFATGVSDRNLRTEPSLNRARPASAAPYRTAGVSNEAAALADGPTPDWQPGVAKGGVPKAAIGALGAALVGGVALAIVLMAPSNKVVKQVSPDPIAQATAQNSAAQKSVDSTTAAVNEMDKNAPAAGHATTNAAAANDGAVTDTKTTTTTATTKVDSTTTPAIPAPVQAVIPHAPPVVAPVTHEHHVKATASTPRVAPQPQQQVTPTVTRDVPAPAPVVTPPADVQAPAMQQTPDTPTVSPAPTPAPTPDTPAPIPVPAPTE